MGLDMYLHAKTYVSGYNFSKNDLYDVLVRETGVEPTENSPSFDISATVGYWRKENAIHSWFVNNVQNGVDNCEEFYVPREKLEELRDICKEVIETKNTDLLETQSGFFFGSTDYDDWYYQGLEYTVNMLDKILSDEKLKNYDFFYRASW
jgi:hypothetical protein